MNAQDCLNMLREMRDVVFSTADAPGFPHARMIDVMTEGEGALYFRAASGAPLTIRQKHCLRLCVKNRPAGCIVRREAYGG